MLQAARRTRPSRKCQAFTEDDEALIRRAIRAFDDGVVAKATAKKLKKALEKEIDPLRVLALVRKHVPAKLLEDDRKRGAPGWSARRSSSPSISRRRVLSPFPSHLHCLPSPMDRDLAGP